MDKYVSLIANKTQIGRYSLSEQLSGFGNDLHSLYALPCSLQTIGHPTKKNLKSTKSKPTHQ